MADNNTKDIDFYNYMIDNIDLQINKHTNSKVVDEMMRYLRTLIEDFYKDYRRQRRGRKNQ